MNGQLEKSPSLGRMLLKVYSPREKEKEKLGKFSEFAIEAKLQGFDNELKVLDKAFEEGLIADYIYPAFLFKGRNPVDASKYMKLLLWLESVGALEAGAFLQDQEGQILKDTFNSKGPRGWPDEVIGSKGDKIPSAGLRVVGVSKLKI